MRTSKRAAEPALTPQGEVMASSADRTVADASPAEATAEPWAGCAETHTAVVYFAGDRAAKLKKPVDLGFVDFTTLEARKAACRNEVRLNRRFAPDVYLGVGEIRDDKGQVIDHMVLMRRMPSNRRLATLVREHVPVQGELRTVARMLAAWHARAPRGPGIDRQAAREALAGRWADSFAQIRALPPALADHAAADIDEIERLVMDFLDGRAALFARRIAEHRVVDGHGDLLADDVFCLDDGPRVLDCLEFDENLRSVDGLDDAAFLAMDLERLGAPELARKFLGWYVEFSGDPAPTSLWHHFVAYRAFVRAKVGLMRCAQGDARARGLADEYLALTRRHLQAGAVRLVLVGGLPGTGKSTVAGRVADTLGMTMLSTDRMRKESVGIGPDQHADAALYAPDRVAANYDAVLARARALLALGESVVLDATWNSADSRAKAARLAAETRAEPRQIECTAPSTVIAERLAARHGGWSDADAAVAEAMAHSRAPWDEAIELDTSAPADAVAARAVASVLPLPAERVFVRKSQMAPD